MFVSFHKGESHAILGTNAKDRAQDPVVRRPISANPGLDFNLSFFIPLL